MDLALELGAPGVSDRIRRELDRVQPYHRSPPSDHPLAVLHALDLIDQHRLPLAAVFIGGGELAFVDGDNPTAGLSESTPRHSIRLFSAEPQVIPVSEAEMFESPKLAGIRSWTITLAETGIDTRGEPLVDTVASLGTAVELTTRHLLDVVT